jgi:hypothetical protein
MKSLIKLLLISLLGVGLLPPAMARGDGPSLAFKFNGQVYEHRWSQGGQNEFTPQGQDDLDHWQDMMTINVFEDVRDTKALSAIAGNTLENYQGMGKIIRSAKVGAVDGSTEFLVVAVLSSGTTQEANFARFTLTRGMGLAIISQHRAEGAESESEMSAWLLKHGQANEDKLMAWDGMPTAKALQALSP